MNVTLLGRECQRCSKKIERTDPRTKFCSDSCCTKFHNEKKKTATILASVSMMSDSRPCFCCGEELPLSVRRNPSGRFCSAKCKDLNHTRERNRRAILPVSEEKVCGQCGGIYMSVKSTQVWCSGKCRESFKTRRRRLLSDSLVLGIFEIANEIPRIFIACVGCGLNLEFDDSPAKKAYCSVACRGRAAKRRANRRRSGRVSSDRSYSDGQIFNRDGWTCHLCGGKVDKSLSRLDSFGATIDHLIPLSRGGSDDIENVATAHRVCNTRRSNRDLVTL